MAGLFNAAKRPAEKAWREQNNCTYFCSPEQIKDKQAYVMGFSLEIMHSVCSTTSTEGGWVCHLRHVNHPPDKIFKCYITSSGWQSRSEFHGDIAKTPGMPGVVIRDLDHKLLGSYIAWKNHQYASKCKARGVTPDRMPVEHRNLQNDGKTMCFAPDLFFKKHNGIVSRVDADSTDYVWVPSLLKNLTPLTVYGGAEKSDVLETINSKLTDDNMADTFICFLLMCGHTNVLSLHYKSLLETLEHVPGLVVTGPRHTGKTLGLEVSACFLGTNGIQLCVAKDITLSALRDRYTKDHAPLKVHDCNDPATMATAAHECFEGRSVIKAVGVLIPGASVAFTCNEQPMQHLRSKMEALSRVAVIPMPCQMSSMSPAQYEAIRIGKLAASRHFEALVCLSDLDKDHLRQRYFELLPLVSEAMVGLQECSNRIPENYALLTAATELFLDKTAHQAWIPKVQPFVLKKLLPLATPFYIGNSSAPNTAALGSQSAKTVALEFCRAVNLLRQSDETKVAECVVVQNKPFVAVQDKEFTELTVNHGLLFDFETVKNLESVAKGQAVNFSGKAKRAICVPKKHFSTDQLAFLKGEIDLDEAGAIEPLLEPAAETLSPFKSASAEVTVSNETPRTPLAHSTPREDDDGQQPSGLPAARQRLEFNHRTGQDLRDDQAGPSTSAANRTVVGGQSGGSTTGNRSNASFTITNKAIPGSQEANETLPSGPTTLTGKKHKKAGECCGCDLVNDVSGKPNTYACSKCKKRYHMTCQDVSGRWPENIHKKRTCQECILAALLE